MKKTIPLLIFIILSYSCYAYDFTYEINSSSLPFSKTEYVLISLPHNITNETSNNLTFSYGQFLSGISSISLQNNSYNLSISILIPFSTLSSNYTSHANSSYFYNITNSTLTANFTFFFSILNNSKNFTPFFFIDESTFGYEICDYSIEKTTYSTTFSTSISSTPNSSIRILCSSNSFVQCPEPLFTPSSVTSIALNIIIPVKKTIGSYSDILNFYQDNLTSINGSSVVFSNPISDNITLKYNIKDCPKPLGDFTSCNQPCNSTNINDFLDCVARNTQCLQDVYDALLEANRTREVNNSNIYNNTIEVPVLAYSPNLSNLINQYYELTVANNKLLIDSRGKQDLIDKLQSDKDSLASEKSAIQSQIPLLVRQSVFDLLLYNQNVTNRLSELEDKTISNTSVYIISFLVLLGILSISGFYYYKKTHFY